MNRVLSLLGLGAALAVLKALVVALVLGVLLTALACLFRWPRETAAWSCVLVLGGLAATRPAAALVIVAVLVAFLGALHGHRHRKSTRLLKGP